MTKMMCEVCGWVYDPATGYPAANILPGTDWQDVPISFVCPECGADKNSFVVYEQGTVTR